MVATQPLLERLPLQEFHRNERLSFVLSDFINRADVRMVERRGGARFAPEAFEGLGIVSVGEGSALPRERRALPYQELERHQPAELRVLGLVNHAHAATTEFVENTVVRNRFADHVG